ncbi:MAG: Gfo/Idh/MocA family oxidoreductase [Pyrinomonadaceae bacterium MAG19_C2-C3]|nr:Gfo/Idh/MocA family oxidoreductase [Pyrinomonadaceae bacterium MAG19_C2-C3]
MDTSKQESVEAIVVGCGAVSQMLYAPALEALERIGEVKVVGLVDPAKKQKAGMQKMFPSAAAYDSLEQHRLSEKTLVIVATPPKFHAPQTIYALQQGASVLCEKPMAASVAEAETMIEAAGNAKGVLAVGIFRRFFPAFEAMKSIIDNKPFGSLQKFAIQEGGKFAWAAASDSFFRRDMTMGGVFYDLGVYVVDSLLWWMGEPEDFIYQDDAMGGVEANCHLNLTYADNVRGTVRLSRDWQTPNRYDFQFENAKVVYESSQVNHLKIIINGLSFALDAELESIVGKIGGNEITAATRTNPQSFTAQLRNVMAAMKGQQQLRVPGEEAIRSLRFIENCYASRALMEMSWLSNQERKRAETLAAL